MTSEQFLAFVVFAVVTSITPGPNTMMLTATGANVGIRRGLPHLFGVAIGFALMLFAVAAGLGATLLADPSFLVFVRYAGIAVLLWLAWKIATAGRAKAALRERPVGFWEAVAFQWVNPKAWMICVAAVGGYLQPGASGAVAQAALFALIFMAFGLPCAFAWLGFGAVIQRFLTTDRALRAFNIVMGLVLAASIVLLF